MAGGSERAEARRRDAEHFGRNAIAHYTELYRQTYRLPRAPAPALIISEILTDFVGAKLSYDPLPTDRYAQTRWDGGRAIVTVNSNTHRIPGVKDAEGVQRVAMCHELIHVLEDGDEAHVRASRALSGFEAPAPMIAFRTQAVSKTNPSLAAREARAEHAGRAAAVSLWAVEGDPAWKELVRLSLASPDGEVPFGQGFHLLYAVAEGIGVNISALIKQLGYDGRLVLPDGQQRIWVPRSFHMEEEPW